MTTTTPALVWPREMPSSMPFRAVSFEPSYQQSVGTTRGGLQQVANTGVDLWRAKYETPPLSKSDALEWRAWLHSLRGGARLFKAWDPVRRYARAYPSGYGGLTRAGGGSFDGTANLSAIASARDALTLSTLPVGFKLGAGDLLSFAMGDLQALHEVIIGGTAAIDGTLAVTIEPTLSLPAVTGVTVSLAQPWFKAVVTANSISGPWQLGQRMPVAFTAMQVFV